MNKNKELVKNTIIISVGKMCTQCISFLLLPFYTALLSTEEFGVVDLVTTYVQLLLPIVFLEIDQAIFRFLTDKRNENDEKQQLISSALVFIVFQVVIFSVLYLISTIWFENKFGIFLYINVLAISLANFCLQISRGLGKNGAYAVASFLTGFFGVVLNIFLIAGLNLKAEGMMLATFISNLICIVYLFFKCHIYEYIRWKKINKKYLKDMMKYSVPLVSNALSWWLVNASDRSIVLFFCGTSANGILAAAHKVSSVFISVYNMFNLSWTESASLHLKEDDKDEFFSNTVDVVYRLFMAGCIGIIAIMPFVFSLMVNESYKEAYNQIPIYMIAGMFNVIAGLYSVVYIANKKTKEIGKTSIVSGLVNIFVNIALIKFIGLYAASISSMVAYALMAIYRCFDVRKYIKQKIDYQMLISSFSILTLTVIGYYSNSIMLQFGMLIVAIIYAVIINKKLVFNIYHICIKRWNK